MNLPLGQYAISGSGSLGICNLRVIGDVDIIVTIGLWNTLAIKLCITEDAGIKKIVFPDGIVEALYEDSFIHENNNDVPTIAERIAAAEIIDGLPFESLEHVLYFKRKMGREKDMKDIQIIESFQKKQKNAERIVHFIDKNVLELMKENNVPGISIAIINDGEIVSHQEYGFMNSKTNKQVEENSVFESASLSKPVFAYGVLQMVESGKLDLDTPLVNVLSHIDVPDDKNLDLMTARMVLSHTTGFPNWRPKDGELKIHFKPGEKFSYSGEGYVYLQKVLELLSGMSLEEYIKNRVFIPLGMTHSSFVWQNEYEILKASGHNPEGTPIERVKPTKANAAYTLHTTPLDYAKFVIALMNDKGLMNETIHQMIRPQIKVEEGRIDCTDNKTIKLSETISWGLGLGIQTTSEGELFWHWGDNNGFKSFIIASKEEKNGIIIFTNSSNGLKVISKLVSQYFGHRQYAFDWLDSGYSFDKNER
ncbi:MAG: beta-lactamase family protein [Parachlamydiaceae bacterium]|nr:beta-lactamase family protein [Parachlamydiaceae bacterium]